MHAKPDRAYLSACTIYRDHADDLAEWIEFHLLVGVERFFLYDNGSRDHHRDVLAPYVDEGLVELESWGMPFSVANGRPLAALPAFEHCLRRHRDDTRWIAFLDIDEFLFSPTGRTVAEILPDYERHPGVGVSRREFGPSGHRTRPAGLTIESYVQFRQEPPDARGDIKSIVDPRRTRGPLGMHHFLYSEGCAVDEQKRPIAGLHRDGVKPISFEKLRVNHYGTKSEQELEGKFRKWGETGDLRRPSLARASREGQESVDTSLATYAPRVREALARRSPAGRD
jgi:glycosyl transferase family 92